MCMDMTEYLLECVRREIICEMTGECMFPIERPKGREYIKSEVEMMGSN